MDGLILIGAGAGGHAGQISPFALIPQVSPEVCANSRLEQYIKDLCAMEELFLMVPE